MTEVPVPGRFPAFSEPVLQCGPGVAGELADFCWQSCTLLTSFIIIRYIKQTGKVYAITSRRI